MKSRIEKGSVQETLLIPLYGRKMAMDLYPDLFADHACQQLIERIEFEAPPMTGIKAKIGALMAMTRQYDMAEVCRRYLKQHPKAAVINLGCGLDTTFSQADNGLAVSYNLDLPDVICMRNELLPPAKREHNIACDLNDLSWMDAIPFCPGDGAVFFASGLFYYFKAEDVRRLLCEMAKRFPGGKIVFDATNAKGLRNMLKIWLKSAGMQNVGLYFSVEDEHDLLKWSKDFASVIRKGYMTGYRPLDRRYGFLANAIFRFGDWSCMCQIIEIEFRSEAK
ncbi:MAG: class I SAM-dependent methyltransferase [Clostridia bacterium]|nr:class I SAM-dependent methyltransferase [Clostridia bacterium]